MSTDSTSNLGFSNTLKMLRQKQFASIPVEDNKTEFIDKNNDFKNSNIENNNNKNNNEMFIKKHMSFIPSSNNSNQNQNDEYFNSKHSESFKQKKGLSFMMGNLNDNSLNNENDNKDINFDKSIGNEEFIKDKDTTIYESILNKKKSLNSNNNNTKLLSNEQIKNKDLEELEERNANDENEMSRNDLIKSLIKNKMDKILNKNDDFNSELIKKIIEETRLDGRTEKYNIRNDNEEANNIEFIKMNKRKNYVYNLYLYNKYTESKFKRMTICGLLLIIALSIVVAFTFSESLKNSFLDLVKNIDLSAIEFE